MPATELEKLHLSIASLETGMINVNEFVAVWRAQTELRAALPARFGEVLDDTLMRLESSSLFTDESCSFSRDDLIANLRMWLAKAKQRLADG